MFAERGFDGTAMRALAQAAGTSLSAINYHFGSKEALLEAAFRRRVGPVNALRLERLDALERAERSAPLALEAILDAFLRPIFDVRQASGSAGSRPAWVAARLYSDPSGRVAKLNEELFRDVNERFLSALERSLPGCERRDLEVAQQLTTGMLVHVLSGHVATDQTHEPILRVLIRYGAAGLRSTPGASP